MTMKRRAIPMGLLATLLLALPLAAAPLAANAAAAGVSEARYTDAEIDRLLAPIALYPDSVLSHVLVASTYPLEVVQAARWSREHPDVRGEDAVDAVDGMDWDASVKALVAFPDLLVRMDSDLDWTQDLGDAFLAQEGDVMDRVQVLRRHAYDSGNLSSLEHARVIREREVIYIEPAVTEVVYLPYYDPWVVYGAWWWPAYPPYRWSYWAGRPASYYAHYGTFYWGIGFHLAPRFYFCHFNWPSRRVVVINHYDVHNHYVVHNSREAERYSGASAWRHNPEHRRGVAYRSPHMNQEYRRGHGSQDRRQADSSRMPTRQANGRNPDRNDGGEVRTHRERRDGQGRVQARDAAPSHERGESRRNRAEGSERAVRPSRGEPGLRAERPVPRAESRPERVESRPERVERVERNDRAPARRESRGNDERAQRQQESPPARSSDRHAGGDGRHHGESRRGRAER
jgi:hypothetical protein